MLGVLLPPLVNNPVSLTGHCLCVEVQTEDGTGHTSPIPAFLPPKHHQGHGFSTVKQTLEIPDAPRSASSLSTYLSWPRPLLRPATMCHAAPPTKAPVAPPSCSSSTCQKTQGSSLAESSAKGNIFGQLGARRTLAPWVLAKGHAHQQRQKLLLSQSENFTSTAVRLEHRPHLLMVQKKLSHSSGGQVAGTSSWHLLTEGRPSIEEVGHHLTLALDLDHTAALQLVCVGGQHLVHVCSDLRTQREGKDRQSVSNLTHELLWAHLPLCVYAMLLS